METPEKGWELYNMATDPTEQNDLANMHPEKLQALTAEWEQRNAVYGPSRKK